MSLEKLFKDRKLVISCELFPPKTAKGERNLYDNCQKLVELGSDFITCTYGAGGSTRAKTLEIIDQVKQRFGIPVASHLTLVGSTEVDLREYLERATRMGVDYIVALRGDPPQGETGFRQTPGGYAHANQLVELIHAEFGHLGVLVAGYPEKHREAPSMEVDIENLKRKVDAGADAVITQLFYNNDDFYRFRDQCVAAGISVPIVPGILPVISLSQIQRIADLCGATLPPDFLDRLSEKPDDKHWQHEVGVQKAIEQTEDLVNHGVVGLHFYVLNRADAAVRIMQATRIGACGDDSPASEC